MCLSWNVKLSFSKIKSTPKGQVFQIVFGTPFHRDFARIPNRTKAHLGSVLPLAGKRTPTDCSCRSTGGRILCLWNGRNAT